MPNSNADMTDIAVCENNEPKQATNVKRNMDNNEHESSLLETPFKKKPIPSVEMPIKLFATRLDEQERRNHPSSHWSWTQTRTLREMLGFDTTNSTSALDDHHCDCPQFLIISNFIVDFDFLLNEIPELLSIPRVVVFYGWADNTPEIWKQAVTNVDAVVVDFVQLNPSEPPQSASNPLPYRFPYGCHHTKMFIVGYADRVRVIIHTANLRDNDIHDKTQAAYIEDFFLKKSNEQACLEQESNSSDFENTLLFYLKSYGYNKCLTWLGDNNNNAEKETLLDCLKRYDFSRAKGVLIPSVPGWHKLYGEIHERMGHWKLRHAVANYTVKSKRKSSPIICQFSSIGLLSEKYLKDLQISMDTELSKLQDSQNNTKTSLRFRFIYPTVEEIRNSVEGYSGGGSVPGRSKNLFKPFLKPLLHKWSASQSSSTHANNGSAHNPLVRPRNVPHIKTYYQISDEDNNCFDWFVLGSHNMSKAAWGEVQNSQRFGTRRLFLPSWELGVFLSPQTVQVDRLTYFTEKLVTTTARVGLIPLPYSLHPQPYQNSDSPWAVDGIYTVPDRFGRTYIPEDG